MEDADLTIAELLQFADRAIALKTEKSLSFIQKIILKNALLPTKKTYAQIAQENHYSENYLRQGVAPQLWQLLSEALGEKVSFR